VLELTSYGLTGLVAILLVVLCFACNDEFASFSEPSAGPMFDADLRDLKPVERSTCVANGDTWPQDRKHEWVLHG
jgi:hypothetical protein